MLGLHDQVWVTTALTDQDVHKALVLCYSLKRVYTTRKIALVASAEISLSLRQVINHGFDFVFYLQEDQNTAELKKDDFAKLYSLVALRAFNNCAFLSRTMVALKNCDDIFSEPTKGFLLPEEPKDSSVFLFKPSVQNYDALMTMVQNSRKNGTNIGEYLSHWTKNQYKVTTYLNGKFCRKMTIQQPLLENESDISIVNMVDYPKESDVASLEKSGILGKLIAIHWLKTYQEDVLPLLRSETPPPPLSVQYIREPIAIVGMSCRYPGSNNLKEFWDLLVQGQDGTGNPPPFRWVREQCSRHLQDARKTNAGFLKGPIDHIDSKFFGISPKELLFMDPQHRILHELVWESLEDACINHHSLYGTLGSVFVGSWLMDYKDILRYSGNSEFYRQYLGNSMGAAAARISFLLGMTGPSISTESGCSSAMVAVHMACRSLQVGETNMALACGVNLLLHPFDKDEMPMVISEGGRCKTFSADADGFARGEGAGVLVLKRLSDAVKEGDHIWGLIRGSAVSQEGVSKSMGTPTVHCEALAMQEALRDANVSAEQVSYVEAHGTGTVVGDPMEISAIAKAYNSPNRREPLIIGSVKTNVGHTESCSGVTGIMKTILSMKHETIPAHLNFTELNPSIDLNAVPAVIPLEAMEWKKVDGKPRLAGVSSFGITGTDAHVIIEEPPQVLPTKALTVNADMERPLHLLKFSAKSEEAMSLLLEKYKDNILTMDESLADIAYSINTGRADFPVRAALVAKNKEEVCKAIEQQKYVKNDTSKAVGPICFLFTGQGSQYLGMGKRLYESSPTFRMHFDYCEGLLKSMYNINIREVIWKDSSDKSSEVSRTIYSQTSIFCVEYALLKVWESWGIKPDYALGHSLGEFCAAVCAGILSVEEAITLVAERSKLIDDLPHGKMLVIKASQQQVDITMKRFAGSDKHKMLDYAAINSNEQTVVAGDGDAVMEFSQFCIARNMKCVILEATHAFHSKHMNPILDQYKAVAKTVKKGKDYKCEYISGMKGDLINCPAVDADYWVQHTREPVRFFRASKKAVELGCHVMIEVGPQPVLAALTMMNNDVPLLCLPSLKRNQEEWSTMLSTVAQLYVSGVAINWAGLDQFYNRKKVRLPHYPFIGKKFWPDMLQLTGNVIHPLVGSVIPNASSTKLFQCALNLRSHEYIKDHTVGNTVVFPGAGYLEMCLAAGHATVENAVDSMSKPSRPMKVENLMIQAPLALEESKTCQLQTVAQLNTCKENEYDWNDVSVKVFHRQDSDLCASWLCHVSATFSPIPTAEELVIPFDVTTFHHTLTGPCDEEGIAKAYEKLASVGLKFGPTFRSLTKLWKNESNSTLLAKVKVPPANNTQSSTQHIIHPAVLDAMIQAIMMKKLTKKVKRKLYVPIKIGKFIWLSSGTVESAEERYIHVYEKMQETNGGSGEDLSTNNSVALLLDNSGRVLAIMTNVEFIDTTVKAMESVLEQQFSILPDLWEESWRPKAGPLQYLHDLEQCGKEPFYTAELCEELIETYDKLTPEVECTFKNVENLVYDNTLRCMYECGFTPVVNEVYSENDLFKQLKIDAEFTRLFSYFFRLMEADGIMAKEGPNWKVVKAPPSLEQVMERLNSPTFTVDLPRQFKATSLLSKVGENLSKILQGSQSALGILFPEEGPNKKWHSVGEFYEEYGTVFKVSAMGAHIGKHFMRHCKKNTFGERSILRILEVGSGTGVFTGKFLELLEEEGIEYTYMFTDISAAFFSGAEKKFEQYAKKMTFKKLNIEECPISQGFVPAYYDHIIASDVIHATRNLKETLAHTKMLLKPGGRLDLLEMTRVNKIITYLFGLLDGFWRFNDIDVRPHHCTLSTDGWRKALTTSGFEWIHAFPSLNQHHSYIACRKPLTESSNVSMGARVASAQQKLWVLFHQNDSPTTKFLFEKIQTVANRKVIMVNRGTAYKVFQSDNNVEVTLRPEHEEDFVELWKYLGKDSSIEGIIYGWSLAKNTTTLPTVLKPLFSLSKSILGLKRSSPLKFVSLVSGVVPVEDNDLSHFHPSTIWGFLKSLNNETVDVNCRCIDIGGNETELGMMQVFYEIWNAKKDGHVAFQGLTRYQPKFTQLKPSLSDLKLPNGAERFQLILPETKSFQDLQFGPLDPFILEEEDIEVQVKTSALNFRDVFSVLKPTEQFKDINAVGFDFAGVVKRIGPMVTKWSVGDNVFGVNVNGSALPSHIKLHQSDVLRLPEDMTLCDACTLPAVVATSYHCLMDVAKITPTDTVLVHTASGGVGLSAIDLIKSVGCKIIATAGSKRKRNFLRSLGIKHVFHSRNTDYGDEILKVTNGRGVDVVLNSLTSEGFKEATLKACARGARFVEMSKLSIWKPEEVAELRPDVSYTIADVSSMETSDWRRLMANLEELATTKVIKPIPYVQFDGVHVREALQYLQKAKHIGKIVCVLPEVRQNNGRTEVYTPIFHDKASSYLITGGLGGIGFAVCRWMVEMGARHIVLAGRNPPSSAIRQAIDLLNTEHDAKITAVQLDVSNFEQCKVLIQDKMTKMGYPTLRGVMHAAGTLHDGLIENQTWDNFASTLGTKVSGTLNLHELTKDNPKLEHFVLFSSIAALFGSPGQSNHAAGNNFEDTFAHYRNSIGLPATSVNWGQWGEVGIATEVDLPGLKPFSTLQGITGLEWALKSHRTQTCVVNVTSFIVLSKLFPHISSYLDERIWKSSTQSHSTSVNLKSDEFWKNYDSAENGEKKTELLKEKLRFILRNTLKLDETEAIDDNAIFQEMGVDSLMFVEVKNSLQALLGDRITVNASAMRDCNTVQLLADALISNIEDGEETDDGPPPTMEEVAHLIKEDCQLPEHIAPQLDQKRVDVKDISSVLLTGCSGTLGPYVLKELCNYEQITQITCLMRPKGKETGMERLKKVLKDRDLLDSIDMNKIHAVDGNVSQPKMGMEDTIWDNLCNTLDAVVHCAAAVQHTEHYKKRKSNKDMRTTNIQGLKNVLELSCTGKKLKHVFNASTMLTVSTANADGNISEDWPELEDFDGITTVAYPVSKFVGDLIMKQAVTERGIPGKAFRFPLIVGDSRTGRFVLDQNHFMLRYMFILKTGLIPSTPFPLSLLPVDTCAWASVNLFLNPNAPHDVYNVISQKSEMDQEFSVVAEKLGYNVKIVEFSEFTQKVRESTVEDSPFAMFKEFYNSDESLMSVFSSCSSLRQWALEGGANEEFWRSKKITQYLPEFYNDTSSSMDHVYRDMIFARNQGWLDKYTL